MLKLHWFNSVEYNCCITTKADQIKSVEFEHYGHATEDDLLQHIGLNAQQMISMLISIIIIIINIIIIKKELIIVMLMHSGRVSLNSTVIKTSRVLDESLTVLSRTGQMAANCSMPWKQPLGMHGHSWLTDKLPMRTV